VAVGDFVSEYDEDGRRASARRPSGSSTWRSRARATVCI
jgi:hypothetical protein